MIDKKIPLYDFENNPCPALPSNSEDADDADLVYSITPKGVIFLAVGDQILAETITAALVNFMKKGYENNDGMAAIILEDGKLYFASVKKR